MPTRTVPSTVAGNSPTAIAQAFQRVAGGFDDPIAKVRIDISDPTDEGAGNFSRTIRFTVCDRNDKPYSPAEFRRKQDPALDARWLIWWASRATKYGAPADYGATTTMGLDIGPVGNMRLAQTDLSGVVEIQITKAGSEVWFDAGVNSLQRTKGVDWAVSSAGSGGGGGGGVGPGTGGGPVGPGGTLPDPPSEGIGSGSTTTTIITPVPETAYIPQPSFAANYLILPPEAQPLVDDMLIVTSFDGDTAQLGWIPMDGGSP